MFKTQYNACPAANKFSSIYIHYSNPINYIQFRLKMIKNIIDSNNIDISKIIFYFNDSVNKYNKQLELLNAFQLIV
jgi:hypothetical protein